MTAFARRCTRGNPAATNLSAALVVRPIWSQVVMAPLATGSMSKMQGALEYEDQRFPMCSC